MVGQSPQPGTPSLNIVYKDNDVTCYLIDIGEGNLSFHADLHGKRPGHRLMRKFTEIFSFIILGLIERGMTHLDTWIEDDELQFNFASFFGFEETGFLKSIPIGHGSKLVREMRYTFPSLDGME